MQTDNYHRSAETINGISLVGSMTSISARKRSGAFYMLSAAKIDEPYSGAGIVGFENTVRRLLYSYL